MTRHSLCVALALALALSAVSASAGDIYRWKDANGVTHYSQTPPPSGAYTKHKSAAGSAGSGESTAVQKEKEKESPQCAAARKNIALLEGAGAVQQDTNGDGTPDRTLSPEDRANQLALAQATLKANCTTDAAATPAAAR